MSLTSAVIAEEPLTQNKKSWRSGLFADWSIRIGSRCVPVHRLVLAVGPRSSDFFIHHFAMHNRQSQQWCTTSNSNDASAITMIQPLQETHLQVGKALLCRGCDPCDAQLALRIAQLDEKFASALDSVLDYLYDGTCSPDENSYFTLWRLADYLQINALTQHISRMFDDALSEENARGFLTLAQQSEFDCSSSPLVSNCIDMTLSRLQPDDTAYFASLKLPLIELTVERAVTFTPQVNCRFIASCVVMYLRLLDAQMDIGGIEGLEKMITTLSRVYTMSASEAVYILLRAQSVIEVNDLPIETLERLRAMSKVCIDCVALEFDKSIHDDVVKLRYEWFIELMSHDFLNVETEDEVFDMVNAYTQLQQLSADQVVNLMRCVRFSLVSKTCIKKAQKFQGRSNENEASKVETSRQRVTWKNDISYYNSGFMNKNSGAYITAQNHCSYSICVSRHVIEFSTALNSNSPTISPQTWYWEFEMSSNPRFNIAVRKIEYRISIGLGTISAPMVSESHPAKHGRLWHYDLFTRNTMHHGDETLLHGASPIRYGDVLGMFVEKVAGVSSANVLFLLNGEPHGDRFAFVGVPSEVMPSCAFERYIEPAVIIRFIPGYIPPAIHRYVRRS